MTTAKKRTTAKRTTSRSTTRRSTARRTATRRSTAGRTSSAAYRRRRTKPKVATTVGAALGTLVVAFLLDTSWPVRIGLVALALLLVGGYLVLRGRGSEGELAEDAAPTTPETSPTTDTAEDPPA